MDRDVMMAMSMMTAYIPFVLLSLFLPVLTYVVARWRLYREERPPDPHLGFKTLLSFFRVIAYQAMLLGGFMVLNGLFSGSGRAREAAMRAGVGVLLPAGLVYLAHRFALRQTNADEQPTVVRMFDGISLALTGTVGFVSLLMAGTMLLGEGPSGASSTVWALALVYVVAWGVQGLQFWMSVGGSAPTAAR